MARTILEIYQEIIDEKETRTALSALLPAEETSQNLLDDLTSNSKVAIWRLWAFIIAVAHHVHETFFDQFLIEAQAIADSAVPGTPLWYKQTMLDFQYGDSLEEIDGRFQYEQIDEEKKIIKRCSVEERTDGVVAVKVAKEDDMEQPIPLEEAERLALNSYAAKLKFAGTLLVVTSIDADLLRATYKIYYDPQVPLGALKIDLQEAIDEFLADEIPFDGEFIVTRFTDKLQAVEGVVDPVFQSAESKPANFGNWSEFEIKTDSAAGWWLWDRGVADMFEFIPSI